MSKSRRMKPKLGSLLVRGEHITPQQLEDALAIQKKQTRPLGDMLTSVGLLTERALEEMLTQQVKTNKRLGELLVRQGVVSAEQLERIIVKQQCSRPMLGEILVSLGYVSEVTLDLLIRESLQLETGSACVYEFGDLIVEQWPTQSLGSNCYVLTHRPTAACVLVDAGHHPGVLARVRAGQLKPQAIWLTHGHEDHTDGLAELLDAHACPFYLHPADENFLPARPEMQPLADGDRLMLGPLEFRALHVPGHTPGGVAFYHAPVAITGDTLMAKAVGRYDLVEGSVSDIVASLKNRLLCLPDDTMVFPGHGDASRLAEIKDQNRFCAFLLRPPLED